MTVIINGTNTPTAGGVTYGNGTEYATTSAGTAGQVLTSAGSSAPVWAAGPSGTGGATATGNVTLTSASSGAQSITTTAYGQYVKLPDATTMTKAACSFNIYNNGPYQAKILNNSGTLLGFINPYTSATVGLADSSTAAGAWTLSGIDTIGTTAKKTFLGTYTTLSQSIVLDADRTLLFFGSTSSSNIFGVVYNATTQTWGSMTTLRTSGGTPAGILVSTDKVLMFSCASSALEAVVLSISGTTITVGTAATRTLSGAGTITNTNLKATSLIACGSSYILLLYKSAAPTVIAATVSGTTVTIGASETTLPGTSSTMGSIFYISASTFLAFSSESAVAIYATPYSVSGTTITLGTGATISSGNTSINNTLRVGTISNGARCWVMYQGAAGNDLAVSIVSVSGTTATTSTATALSGFDPSAVTGAQTYADVAIVGSKLAVALTDPTTSLSQCNIVTDTSGTASAGTAVTFNNNLTAIYMANVYSDSSTATFVAGSSASGWVFAQFDISGSSPSILNLLRSSTANTTMWGFNTPYTNWNSQKNVTWLKGKYAFSGTGSVQGGPVSLFYPNFVTNPVLETFFPSTPSAYTSNADSYYQGAGDLTASKTIVRIEVIA